MNNKIIAGSLVIAFWLSTFSGIAQVNFNDKPELAATPPMGWMTWNYFADKINEKDIKEMADAMVSSGMVKAGYNYLMIDDGWQGGRDNRNQIIADPLKFPSGVKSL